MRRIKADIYDQMNELGAGKVPFFFLIDFLQQNGEVTPLSEIEDHDIQFSLNNSVHIKNSATGIEWNPDPVDFQTYEMAFCRVKQHIMKGNSYLCNLTFPTDVHTNLSLDEIYSLVDAKYKLKYKGLFVCFSPETFVKIENGIISTYPMKGTIDAGLPDAEQRILNDKKEMAEHYTIVDLLRNDLSRVADNVRVEKFRYIDRIKTNHNDLLQVSSKITGELPGDYASKLGDIYSELLPAGSICGAPKDKTVEIILEAETYERCFYTGVFGVFDGQNVDSAVLIRFIEKTGSGLVFKSGGGITHLSKVEEEYNELIQKVYVPVH